MQKSVLRECQKLSAFDQFERKFLMQERHEKGRTESVTLGPACQTSWFIENLHHKSCNLPDPDIFSSKDHTLICSANGPAVKMLAFPSLSLIQVRAITGALS